MHSHAETVVCARLTHGAWVAAHGQILSAASSATDATCAASAAREGVRADGDGDGRDLCGKCGKGRCEGRR